MPSTVKHHRAILNLLGVDAVTSAAGRAAVAKRERACGVSFPASVTEWFSVENAEVLFHDNTNQDHLEKLVELGRPAEVAQGYLRVATENQAVVSWYVRLTEGDDPPVYDDNDEWDRDLAKVNWRRTSETFTNFIFDSIAGGRFRGWYSGAHFEAEDRMPDANEVRRLSRWLRRGPATRVPHAKVLRFFNDRGVIFARSVTPDAIAAGRAQWTVEADSPEALFNFGRRLWGIGTLSRTLKARSCTAQSRAVGEGVLQRLRAAAAA